MAIMPQFPLGTVLFPTMVLPLHVFEPRYRTMVAEVLDGDGTFGVVLIERGADTGGGDHRTDFGTTARVLEAEQFSDGRWALITMGVERFRVHEWLPDDPYPQAEVELWPDTDDGADLHGLFQSVSAKFRRCLALAAESGLDVGPLPPQVDDVGLGCMQMSALAPVTSLDKQRLLGAPGPSERLQLLDVMIDDSVELIEARLTDS
ncbi:MAG: LON peptidase substrate-binding domain-containing protein [Actinomycetota bacterium]